MPPTDPARPASPSSTGSLARATILKMALRVSLVVIAASALTYSRLVGQQEAALGEQLVTFTADRAQIDGQWLDYLENKLVDIRAEFISRYRKLSGEDVTARFDHYFETRADGATYVRRQFYSGTDADLGDRSVSLSGGADPIHALTPERRLRLILAMEMLRKYGPSLVGPATTERPALTPFLNFYFFNREKDLVVFWPGTEWYPDFAGGFDFAAQGDFTKTFDMTLPLETRDKSWTGTYRDEVPKVWMVSYTLPIDIDGRNISALGADIALADINQRLAQKSFPGATSFILRQDGRVIAHPGLEKALIERKGDYRIDRDGDPALRNMYRLLVEHPTSRLLDDTVSGNLVSVARIPGPDWLYVTIYPKRLFRTAAANSALFVFGLGVLSLLIEIIVLWRVLGQQVMNPLRRSIHATRQMTSGDPAAGAVEPLPLTRDDELGELARSFQTMAEALTQSRAEEAATSEKLREHSDRLEAIVEARTAQLKTSIRDLESFSYTVSHDLRAPIRTINGFATLLEQQHATALDAEARDCLGRIRGATEQMSELIEDMMNLANANHAMLHIEDFDLSGTCESIIAALRAGEPGRRVSVQIEPGLHVAADAALMRVVLRNLIENAWKYTALQPDARIEVGAVDMHEGRAFFVRDNGVGFNMSDVATIFEPFKRLHGKEFGGNGVGLATVHRVLERHGGWIRAESRVGKGSCFTFQVPAPTQG